MSKKKPKKRADELTDKEVARLLFPNKIRQAVHKEFGDKPAERKRRKCVSRAIKD